MNPVSFSDLNPRKSKIIFFGKTYILKPFSLAVETWVYYEFQTEKEMNGVKVLSNRLRDINDKDAILRTIHKLIIDKTDFKTYEDFLAEIDKLEQKDIYLFLMDCHYALSECIGVSQPMIDNIEEEIELKKLKAAEQK